MKPEIRLKQNKGFTLLEVLVAMAILAISLGALVKASGDSALNAAYLRDKTLAHWVAQNKAVELQLRKQWPQPGILSGTEEMADREWYWEVSVKETTDEYVRNMTISVRAGPEQESPLTSLISYLAKTQ